MEDTTKTAEDQSGRFVTTSRTTGTLRLRITTRPAPIKGSTDK